MDGREALGWEVATFAADRLAPADRSAVGSSIIWDTYCTWCRDRNAVPLAFAVFHAEFEKIAGMVGITRRQTGAHVHYEGVRIETGATT